MPAQPAAARLLVALALVAAVTAVTAVTACRSADPITGPEPVGAVAVTAPVAALAVGQTTTVTAEVTNAAGEPLTGRTVTWSSNAGAIATVSPTGQVTAVAPGTVRIRASSEGVQGSVVLEVLPRTALVASIGLDVQTLTLAIGETYQLTATPRDEAGEPVTGVAVSWAWASGGPHAATVSPGGAVTALVTAQRMGITTVTATVDGRAASAVVRVLGDSPVDLVFDRWSTDGAFERPWLYRLDLRAPDAWPTSIFQFAGASDAAPSPDGTRLAFVCDNGGPAICVANADGSGAGVLPGFSAFGGLLGDQPAWSPDGSRIAFRGWMPGGAVGLFNPGDIWVMNADGSGRVRLTSGVAGTDSYAAPAWSPQQPDGSYRIAFAHETSGDDGYARATIQSMRADGQDRRAVTAPGVYVDAEPTWSPDGGRIAFVRTGGEAAGDVWLVNAAGGGERALLRAADEPAGAQRAPAWSPTGELIAFASNHEIVETYYAYQIYTARADGTELARRTADRMEKGNPAWVRRP